MSNKNEKSTELNENELNDVSGGLRTPANTSPRPTKGSVGRNRSHAGKSGSGSSAKSDSKGTDTRDMAPGASDTSPRPRR